MTCSDRLQQSDWRYPVLDLPNTEEVPDARVPSDTASPAKPTALQRACPAAEVPGHCSRDKLLRET